MAGKYALQVSCTLNGIKQRFLLDTIDDSTIKTSSNLSSHPIAEGDYVSDHLYRQQSTLNFDGSYSLNSGTNLNLGTGNSRLATFESLFETIKNKGIICELLKIAKDNSSNSRFLKRTNMVLTSIEWTEKINSLGFSFSFTQIITSESATNAERYVGNVKENLGTFDSSDENLPSYNIASLASFYNSTINYNGVCSKLNNKLININPRTKQISVKIKALGTNGLKAIGLDKTKATLVLKCFASYTLNNSDKLFSEGFVNNLNTSKLTSKFESDMKVENSDITYFANYLYSVYNKINLLNDNIRCYQCNSSGEQNYRLLIDNVYYQFSFTRNNTNNTYYLSVRNTTSNNQEYMINSLLCSSAPTNFSDCNLSNRLFKTENYYVYLLRLKDGKEKNLNSYYIILTKFEPESFCLELDNVIYGE